MHACIDTDELGDVARGGRNTGGDCFVAKAASDRTARLIAERNEVE